MCYGPPGTGKTQLVRAAARATNATFLSLSGADVYSPYVGDAEASIRQIFSQARAALPAILFFDEIDAIVTKRDFNDDASATELRVLSTFLNEMDGVSASKGQYSHFDFHFKLTFFFVGLLVIGATNRPDRIDPALLRPGRFDRLLYIDSPSQDDRLEVEYYTIAYD